jgi:serine/threonine protein kinase
MSPVSSQCKHVQSLLPQSLEDDLAEDQELLIADHLSDCEACRSSLEVLAGDRSRWENVSRVLREETSGEHPSLRATRSMLLPRDDLSRMSSAEDRQELSFQPEDFMVDFLQPSTVRESLGRLGDIEIRQYIGRGAHGIVLKGYQEELQRLVAVKVMAPHLASVAAARKRFAREARAAAAIVHPNVMPILQVDSSGQLPFLVMPYVDCESLQDRLDRDSTLPVNDVLRIGIQVAQGLEAAHAQGLVHRDVKPANILLERGVERVMLTDFGLARTMDDATLTRSGLIAGTPHYMSPEQARGDTVDQRSDLFSLGSVMYAMLAGRPPFRAETTYGILRRVTDDTPRAIREINPESPPWMCGLVSRLLHKQPDGRFESAAEVAELLQQCLKHQEQPEVIALPRAVRQLAAHSNRPWRLPGRYWQFASAVVLLLIVVAAFQPGLRQWFTPNKNENGELAQSGGIDAVSRNNADSQLDPDAGESRQAASQRQASAATVEEAATTRPVPAASENDWRDGVADELVRLSDEIDALSAFVDAEPLPDPSPPEQE